MKNIVFIGQITDISGYGNAARSYLESLLVLNRQRKINLKIINFSFEKAEVNVREEVRNLFLSNDGIKDIFHDDYEEYEVIFFLTNDNMLVGKDNDQDFLSHWGRLRPNLYRVCKNAKNLFPCVVWETDKAPKEFVQAYRYFDNIERLLCACSWNEEVYHRQTGLASCTIPYPLHDASIEFDQSMLNKINAVKKGRFSFCFISQWGYRKGFDILLKSFLIEFENEPVDLVIKTYINKALTLRDETEVFKQEIDRMKKTLFPLKEENFDCKIIVINSLLSKEEINSIYKSADCFVSCTRGEGFGLPIAEFINFSKPVIVPDKGGHLDFCSKDNFFIQSNYEPCSQPPNHLYTPRMNIVEASVSSTMSKMREAYDMYKNDRSLFEKRGEGARDFLLNYLNVERNVKLFEEVLGL